MYTTKPLSAFKNSPAAAAQQPVAPNSGYLLLRDEEVEPNPTCCWGFCEDTRVRELPFPQNRILTVTYTEQQGEHPRTHRAPAIFIPVLGKPLSSNLYYVIVAEGRKKGKANTSSREEDMTTCCFCRCIKDVKPSDFDPHDAYQMFEIIPKSSGRFTAKSLAPDGFAPWLMRQRWTLHASRPKEYELAEAEGLDKALRAGLPPLTAAASSAGSVVGRWYAPCLFVKEGGLAPSERMKESAFYEVVLQQRWAEVYASENLGGQSRVVVEVKARVQAEAAEIDGKPAVREKYARREGDGVVWFKTKAAGEVVRVGLRAEVWERMRWEERRGGWDEEEEEEKVVERMEQFAGEGGGWRRFGCFVLVERFAVKRMNGSLVLAVDFYHCNTIQTRWE